MKKNMTNVIAMALTTAMAFAGVTACGSSSTTTTAAATEAQRRQPLRQIPLLTQLLLQLQLLLNRPEM